MRKLTFEQLRAQRPQPAELSASPRNPVVTIVDNIRSLHNVGSIFRTADGARIEELVLCGITGTPPRAEIRKTSLGAEECVPWRFMDETVEAVGEYRQRGYQIVVLEHTTASIDYRAARYRFPLCLVVGHEFHGVQESVIQLADAAVEIPMCGVKASLNVAVAFGIAVYEVITHWQRRSGGEEGAG